VDDLLPDFFEALFYTAPTFVTLIVGMVWAVATREKHPHVSPWALLGFGWLFGVYLASLAWNKLAVPELFPDPPPISAAEGLSYLVLSALEAIGFVFLMVAVFGYRWSAKARQFEEFLRQHDADKRR
jgi:hypothetical protein